MKSSVYSFLQFSQQAVNTIVWTDFFVVEKGYVVGFQIFEFELVSFYLNKLLTIEHGVLISFEFFKFFVFCF